MGSDKTGLDFLIGPNLNFVKQNLIAVISMNFIDYICSDPVDRGVVILSSLKIWQLWGSTFYGSKRLIKVMPICYQ